MMLELPKVQAHMEGVPEVEQEAALNVLPTKGLALLPDAVLAERVRIQADFLKTLEPEPCKSYLDGTLPGKDAVRYREKLSPAQRARWREIKFLAVELPLTESAQRAEPTEEAVGQAYLACIAALPKEDSERLAAGLPTMPQALAPEACWLGIKLHEAILLAPPEPQAIMARKLFNP